MTRQTARLMMAMRDYWLKIGSSCVYTYRHAIVTYMYMYMYMYVRTYLPSIPSMHI